MISTGGNIWAVNQSTQAINIVAGNPDGTTGYSGDGSAATATSFWTPWGMASGASGSVLVADSGNDRVRQIAGSIQIVTTIAGGYVGDGGRATAASLNPFQNGHTAFDAAGNLYIADSNDHRVRKVSATGTITTFAGTGITGYTGDGGPATAATLNNPTAVAADGSGNIFITDSGNGVVRKVDIAGAITTFFHLLVNSFEQALAVDTSGNIYASDGLAVIWKISPSGSGNIVAGVQDTVGYNGDGIPATQAWLSFPNGVAVDGAGNLYISDWLNNRIRKVDTSGIISTVAGNGNTGFSGDGGPATSATLFQQADVALDSLGNFYIADRVNCRVRVVNRAGIIQTLAGSGNFGYNGDGLPATQTNLFPSGLAVRNGVVYVSDEASYRVRRIH